LGKQTRLIKSAFPLPSWMQWHGYNYVELATAQALVLERCAEPMRHEMSQMNLMPVLKVVDDLADDPATPVCCHCCIEVNRAMGTVGACERARNSSFEGFGALLTKRRNDAHRLSFTSLAEIFASVSSVPAPRAYWRVKKRHGRFEQFKLVKYDHISARRALPAR
jgi:hypothetical protein